MLTYFTIYLALGVFLSFIFHTDEGRVITNGGHFIIFLFIWPVAVVYFIWASFVNGCTFKFKGKPVYRWKGFK